MTKLKSYNAHISRGTLNHEKITEKLNSDVGFHDTPQFLNLFIQSTVRKHVSLRNLHIAPFQRVCVDNSLCSTENQTNHPPFRSK